MFKPFYVDRIGADTCESYIAIAAVNRHFYLVDFSPAELQGRLVKYSEDEFYKKFAFDRFIDRDVLSVPARLTEASTKEAYCLYAIEDGLFYLVGYDKGRTMMAIDGDALCSRFTFYEFGVPTYY